MRFAILLSIASIGSACSCADRPSPTAEWAGSEAVFAGIVLRTTPVSLEGSLHREGPFVQLTRVNVEESFKGAARGQQFTLRQGWGCSPHLVQGVRMLFYVSRLLGEFTASSCGRTPLIEDAAEDLLFLAKLPDSAKQTRVSGRVTEASEPVAGIRVKIIGEAGSTEVNTNPDCVYEAYGLPPGRYRTEAACPLGKRSRPQIIQLRHSADTRTFDFRGQPGLSIDLAILDDVGISGRVLDAAGNPIRNVCVLLLTVDRVLPGMPARSFTDSSGSYTFEDLPPASYYVAANCSDTATAQNPFPPTYYPGGPRYSAHAVTVKEGERRRGIDIRIPAFSR